ncbi:hypothetical protein NWF24_30800 [Variovorax paradoxus]|uniref:hypothetical protein n=1 Tax=Variovorax paradoxus TaxID=34073 RepID=UPI0021ACD808|nr:hypothetical protein [Variovorax paradoxus]UVH57179.1 hypothetical protein NWF24_30800 [Variovorax paradoxus]
MFRVQEQFELVSSALSAMAPGVQHFHLVEQVFEVPLWLVKVRPSTPSIGERVRWNCYLATRAADACGIVLSGQWAQSRVHVLLPGYMTADGMPTLARCDALWECCAIGRQEQISWLFETDHGLFIDPQDEEISLSSANKTLRWKDFENGRAEL